MEIAILVILIVLVVGLYVVGFMKKKKFNTEISQMRQDLKNGDRVMTDSGVVGEIVDSYQEDEYKYFIIKSGKGSNVGYFTVHANSIYYVYDKKTAGQEKVVVKVNSANETTEKTEENAPKTIVIKPKKETETAKTTTEPKKSTSKTKKSSK